MAAVENLERDYSKPDPVRVFNAIADIVSQEHGIKVTVKAIRKINEDKTA